ncbi:MAG: BBP7 family outer membrane beta-barrel protein, partial [Fuerstiella sp.]|nr:BBP7 family outer membrane beta-barrel protein [Fuerstiella sp.]
MWHTEDRDSPALVATGPASDFPILPNGQVAFGDKLKGEFSGGFRLDTGKYVTENFGVGLRFWVLANNDDSFSATATTDPLGPGQLISMSRPFFNTATPPGTEDEFAISSSLPLTEGKVWADSAVNMWAAEAYTRLRLNCNNNYKVDFLPGYSHLNLDDTLRSSSDTTSINNNTRFI